MDKTTTQDKTAYANTTNASTDFVRTGNNADFVRLIKDAAIFQYDLGANVGTLGPDWRPAEGKQPLGYYSEDGLTIHPEAGDSNDFAAHNGDTVLSWNSGGYWTLQFAGLESKKEVIETYFDTSMDATGAITVSSAEANTAKQYVIAGLTQAGDIIIVHIPKAKIGEREDVVWTVSDLMSFGMTLRAFRDDSTHPYFFKMFGAVKGTVSA